MLGGKRNEMLGKCDENTKDSTQLSPDSLFNQRLQKYVVENRRADVVIRSQMGART
jgi:hypothetical protein